MAGTLWIAASTVPAPALLGQSLCDLLIAGLVFDAILFRYGQWPFAAAYVAQDNVAELAPIYALGFVVATFVLSRIQHAALSTTSGSLWLIGTVLVAIASVRDIDAQPHPSRTTEVWNRELVPPGRVNLRGSDW